MASFGSGLIIIEKSWTEIKNIAVSTNLPIKYDESTSAYEIFIIDVNIVYKTTLYKSYTPDGSNQSQNDSDKTDFENNYKNVVNRPLTTQSKIVNSNYKKTNISSTSYYMAIDLNNAGGTGPYKHWGASSIKLIGINGSGIKSNIIDKWVLEIGTIINSTGSNITIGWFKLGSISLKDTTIFNNEANITLFPLFLDLSVGSGDFTSIADNNKEVINTLNNTSTLEDVSGTSRVLSNGDLIIRANKISGSGNFDFDMLIWYFVE